MTEKLAEDDEEEGEEGEGEERAAFSPLGTSFKLTLFFLSSSCFSRMMSYRSLFFKHRQALRGDGSHSYT